MGIRSKGSSPCSSITQRFILDVRHGCTWHGIGKAVTDTVQTVSVTAFSCTIVISTSNQDLHEPMHRIVLDSELLRLSGTNHLLFSCLACCYY